MIENKWNYLFSLLYFVVVVVVPSIAVGGRENPVGTPGIVLLDELTFNKTVKKFPFVFVQISDGSTVKTTVDKKNEFSLLNSEFLGHNSDILAAEVRLQWGDPETKRLATRFQIMDNLALPEFILFSVDKVRSKPGRYLYANETRYGGEVNVKQMVYFLKGKTETLFNDLDLVFICKQQVDVLISVCNEPSLHYNQKIELSFGIHSVYCCLRLLPHYSS